MKLFSFFILCLFSSFLLTQEAFTQNHKSDLTLTRIVLENLDKLAKDTNNNRILIKTSSLRCFAASDIPYGTCHIKGEFPDAGGPNGALFAIIVGMNDEGRYWFRASEIVSWD